MLSQRSLIQKLQAYIHHKPTDDQAAACACLAQFFATKPGDACMILRGFAGTGKTTLLAALVGVLEAQGINCLLLAPTGRAAKVLQNTTRRTASTIHKAIYTVSENGDGQPLFGLAHNEDVETVYIIDEASMIGSHGDGALIPSHGSLLDDLVQFVSSGQDCRLLLAGDTAQLPPINDPESPALSDDCMLRYFHSVLSYTMHDIVRQDKQSGILHWATHTRNLIERSPNLLPQFSTDHFPDIHILAPNQLFESLYSSYRTVGPDETIIVCRSNRAAVRYNQYIRSNILDYHDPICPGDYLMVCKNNYLWAKKNKPSDFLANGEIIKALRIEHEQAIEDFNFVNLDFVLPDQPKLEISATAMLNVLNASSPALDYNASSRLYALRIKDIMAARHRARGRQMLNSDPYFQALQLKYAYAVTCHKAQGGQWKHVYVVFELYPSIPHDALLLRWIYTALTRATEQLYLICPSPQLLTQEAYQALMNR